MTYLKFSLMIVMLFLIAFLFSTTFVNTNADIQGVYSGTLEWGDYDNDGDYDLFVAGVVNSTNHIYTAELYVNDNYGLTNSGVVIPGLAYASSVWGDYNLDGYIDLFISGKIDDDPDVKISELLENVNGVLVNQTELFEPVSSSSSIWFDYNNDGLLDLLLSGYTEDSQAITALYEQNSTGFVNSGLNFVNVTSCDAQACDFDNDGLIDIIISGSDNCNNGVTELYRNNGCGFDIVTTSISDLYLSSIEWGDIDNDGDSDLIICGDDSNQTNTNIYLNNNGTFSDITSNLQAVKYGDVELADIDNDGDIDIVLTGKENSSGSTIPFTSVYCNESLNFVEQSENLLQLWASDCKLCDYDFDGDLDLAISGRASNGNPNSILYRNDCTTPNSVPIPPTNLRISEEGEYFKFEWDMGTDVEQPDISLTYEVKIGSTPGGCDIVSPMALPDGRALKPVFGRINSNCFYLIKSSVFDENETYYWSCQSIDNSFARSAFAEEQSFTYQSVGNSDNTVLIAPTLSIDSVYPNPFNPVTTISYSVSENTYVTLKIYNIKGELVETLIESNVKAGKHTYEWKPERTASGVYFCKLSNGERKVTQKLVLLK